MSAAIALSKATVVYPGEGKAISFAGTGTIFKMYGDTTHAYSVVEHPVDPHVLILPHVHTHEDQMSFVIEGEVGMKIGEEVFQATPGTYLFKPRGIPHTFWNPTDRPARIMEITSPSDFERYFDEFGDLYTQSGGDVKQLQQLAQRYGLRYLIEWVPELSAKYGVGVK